MIRARRNALGDKSCNRRHRRGCGRIHGPIAKLPATVVAPAIHAAGRESSACVNSSRRNLRHIRSDDDLRRQDVHGRSIPDLTIRITPPTIQFSVVCPSARMSGDVDVRNVRTGRYLRHVRQTGHHTHRRSRIDRTIAKLPSTIGSPAIDRSIPEQCARMRRSRIDLKDRGARPIATNFRCAIQVGIARFAHGTSRASGAAIEVRFIAIFDAIGAFRRLTDAIHAHAADAITGDRAHLGVSAFHTRRTAAIDIGFVAVGRHIHTRRRLAHFRLANFARTIRVCHASLTGIAVRTRRAATIDIAFVTIQHLITALRRITNVIDAGPAIAIRSVIALHALPHAVANFAQALRATIALRQIHLRWRSIRRTDADGTCQTIVGQVLCIHDRDLFSSPVA